MYVGYVDFDAFAPEGTTPFDFKESLYASFASGLNKSVPYETGVARGKN